MKKSTFLGSTVGVLLLFSIISYSQTLVQQQRSKSNREAAQAAVASVADAAAAIASKSSVATAAAPANVEKAAPSQSFEATAYSLHGRTASGAAPSTGMIAADPRVLPIGSRVRIEAGSYTGEYVVADTGGAVKGKRIDIWTPSGREAMRFGRRTVKLTVLQLGGKRAAASTRPRTATPAPASTATQNSQKAQQ